MAQIHHDSLPPAFFILSISATGCLSAGLIGLFAPQVIPLLAKPLLAYGFLGAGILLEILSIVELLTTIRARKSSRETR